MSKVWVLPCLLSLLACVEVERDSDSTVRGVRIATVLATPAEAAPGDRVRYRAIVVSPDGELTPPISWSFCASTRSARDNTAAAPACVLDAERPEAASASEAELMVPGDACKRFGSETPTFQAANPSDESGGYYQPLRLALDAQNLAVTRQRIRCALPGAPISVAREYTRDYVPNLVPAEAVLQVLVDGVEVVPTALPAGEHLTVRLVLPEDTRESYLFYDRVRGLLEMRREQLTVSWLVSGGAFDEASTLLDGQVHDNGLHLPGSTTRAFVWLVLRDDRGASSVSRLTLERVRDKR